MGTNEYYYGVTRTDEYLAHYGVKGMKWGVRKAIQSGDAKRLGRQYAKAQKKLAKLEKRAAKTDKYAKRAKGLAAGAAVAGGAAAVGTQRLGSFMQDNAKRAGGAVRGVGTAMVGAGKLLSRIPKGNKVGGKLIGAGYSVQSKGQKATTAVSDAGTAVKTFGRGTQASDAIRKGAHGALGFAGRHGLGASNAARAYDAVNKRMVGVSNNSIIRAGAGAAAAGLGVAAARNAYRAKTAQKKAAQFRSEMNKAFAGTQYGKPRQGKKRRSARG